MNISRDIPRKQVKTKAGAEVGWGAAQERSSLKDRVGAWRQCLFSARFVAQVGNLRNGRLGSLRYGVGRRRRSS